MQVSNVKAEPNPRGGQIDLSWENPISPDFGGVKIWRREFTFPDQQDIDKTAPIHDARKSGQFPDTGLQSETVYYYALAAYSKAKLFPPVFISAMATAAYEIAAQLYINLPALYQRHDTVLPPADSPGLDPADKDKGQLRRLVEMFGLQLDLLRSFAGAGRSFSDVDRIDGALLPVLAQWIGWQTDFTSSLAKQRNAIKYAPHYYRTTGIAANLRATLNRLTTWDAQIKEFVHNAFRTNDPEQLTIWEKERQDGVWKPAKLVTLDVAYEGRPVVAQAHDGRHWLFYHARQSIPRSRTSRATVDHWHLWYKIYDKGEWLPARRLTFSGDINKYPAALQKRDGNFWLFWSAYEQKAGKRFWQIKLELLSAGLPAQPVRVQGKKAGPFAFDDGDQFQIKVDNGILRVITLRQEHFHDIGRVSTAEIAAFLNRQIPRVEVKSADNDTIILATQTTGAIAKIELPVSSVARRLGLDAGILTGSDATTAHLIGNRYGPFSLTGTKLVIRIDLGVEKTIEFTTESFAAQVAAAINRDMPNIAQVDDGKIKLTSPTAGETSFIAIDVNASTAAPVLGFGAPLPPAKLPTDDIEPVVCEGFDGNVWLFWSSRRTGVWKIWYNSFDITNHKWGGDKLLTIGLGADREPAVVFDPAGDGTIWVFWSRKKSDGHWNIFYRRGREQGKNWTPPMELPAREGYDNKEPAAILLRMNNIELYFSSNCADGWNIWSNTFTPAPATNDVQITFGQFTQRAPAALKTDSQTVRLWFRSNESQVYASSLYPAAQTIDARYSGSTTVDARNPAKTKHRKKIQDVQHYTYDTGKTANNWYARDTVGIYLTPDTDDEALIMRSRDQIENVLKSFLPIQVRTVFIILTTYKELIYTYDFRKEKQQRLIDERFFDRTIPETYSGLSERYKDKAPDWIWLRSWSEQHPDHHTVDFTTTPIDIKFRTWHIGLETGG